MFGAPNCGILSRVCGLHGKWSAFFKGLTAFFDGLTGFVCVQDRLAQHALWPMGLHRRPMGGLTKNNPQLLW
jgi:hypothetical protein